MTKATAPLTLCRTHIPNNEAAIAALSAATDLADACRILNEHYRRGEALVSNEVYDHVFIATLAQEAPEHPYLSTVEPEPTNRNLPLYRHSVPLLSTDKCYNADDMARYVKRVQRAAAELGLEVSSLTFRITPKLDGVSAQDDFHAIATRGDGLQGQNITSIIDKGVLIRGERGLGRGEVVVCKAFFAEELGKGSSYDMDHVRNFVAGLIGADTIKPHHQHALKAQAVHFVPFATLDPIIVSADELLDRWEQLHDDAIADVPYLTDGAVVEVNDDALRQHMGATSHHERAVVAIKRAGDEVETTVEDIRISTGRTGRITPTLRVEPIYIDGAMVSNATAHTVANLAAKGLGKGATVRLTRAGSVIPKIVSVSAPAPTPLAVTHCPACGSDVVEEGEITRCPNTGGCPAQTEARLWHWFHTLGNADGFGPSAVAKFVDGGVTTIEQVYALTEKDFKTLGFGPGQSANFVRELARSRTESVMEWRWLAAFGIRHLGRGDARKLLAEIPLTQVASGSVTAEQLMAIRGFGPKTSPAIADSLQALSPTIEHMLSLDFTLEADKPSTPSEGQSLPLTGQTIVFTGTMEQGVRKEMEAQAARMGATLQSDVNAKTTMLVAGKKAGGKLSKAETLIAKGNAITILNEVEYLATLTEYQQNAV